MRAVQEVVDLLKKDGHQVAVGLVGDGVGGVDGYGVDGWRFLVDADHVDGCHHLHADACPHHQHPHPRRPLQVELWQPPGLEEIFNAFVQLLLADKGFHFLRTMKNEARSMTKNHTTRLWTLTLQEIDEAIEVNAMNFKSPPKLKKVMALLFRLVSK